MADTIRNTMETDPRFNYQYGDVVSNVRKVIDESKMAKALNDVLPARTEPRKRLRQYTRQPLGQYLLEVARFYDSLDIDPNVRLLRDQLFASPPLHPRRTLHQSYYWKRHNTENLDQDQLTYKATNAGTDPSRVTRVLVVDQLVKFSKYSGYHVHKCSTTIISYSYHT
jgi:hypothetical protein